MCSLPLSEASTPTQGIQGRVIQLVGDYMPSITPIEPEISTGPSDPSVSAGVQTKVWIFAGRISGIGSPQWPVETAADYPGLVRLVESDLEGNYSAALPPGEYTVFAQYEDMLYLNAFQRDGSFKSVTVYSEEVIRLDLVEASNATF